MDIRNFLYRMVMILAGSTQDFDEEHSKRLFLESLSSGCKTWTSVREYLISRRVFLTKKKFGKLASSLVHEGLIVERLIRYDGYLLKIYMIDDRKKSHVKN